MWYVKTTRSGKRDADGNLPAEVWTENVVCPTLNVFDNGGESRATVLIFSPRYDEVVRIYKSDVAPTVTAYYGTGGGNVPNIVNEPIVRRLTPLECERLQGFPDDWTAGQADSHRYKQMGNAVTVNVIEAIGKNL